jgi:catechol 2,3-dioxygenase-like lactoylglutathione lyase family enzyme
VELSETIYFVNDLDRAVDWYCRSLGFRLLERAEWGFVLLEPPGSGRVALVSASAWSAEWNSGDPLPAPLLSFRCTDIERTVLELANAGVAVGPIEGEDDGVRACWFSDPDGNLFYLWTEGRAA